MVKNPLFLQPDHSFDFGIMNFDQYTVSSTHSSPLHNREHNRDIVRIHEKKGIDDPLTREPFPTSGTNIFLTSN